MTDLTKKKVMIAGHLCLDITPAFTSTDKSNLNEIFSPGKLTVVDNAVLSTGGAVSNTGLAMAKLGVDAVLNGKIGTDGFGDLIKKLVGEKRAATLKTVSDQSSSYTIVLTPPGVDRFFLHSPATNDTFCAEDIDYDLAKKCELFHFGYPTLMKRMYENEGAELIEMYKRIKTLGLTTSLDMAMADPQTPAGKLNWQKVLENLLGSIDIFLPSIDEITFMLDRDLYEKRNAQAKGDDPVMAYNPQDCRDISDKLISMGVKIVVIKCGIRGLYLRTAAKEQIAGIGKASPADLDAWEKRELWAPSFKAEQFGSALGAGDATIAGFLCGLIAGFSPEETLQLANTIGFQNVHTLDALSGIKDWQETMELLKEKSRPRNCPSLDNDKWKFADDQGVYIGPNDRK